MAGRKPFASLVSHLPADRRAAVALKAARLRARMSLIELRKARDLSQEQVAEALAVGQPAVAKLERRADPQLSTLRRYVEALGGELVVSARFADETVRIDMDDALPKPR
jgi:predicted transcriptional regulator